MAQYQNDKSLPRQPKASWPQEIEINRVEVAKLFSKGLNLLDIDTGLLDPNKVWDARFRFIGVHGGCLERVLDLVHQGNSPGVCKSSKALPADDKNVPVTFFYKAPDPNLCRYDYIRELFSDSAWEEGHGLISSAISYAHLDFLDEEPLAPNFDIFSAPEITRIESYCRENFHRPGALSQGLLFLIGPEVAHKPDTTSGAPSQAYYTTQSLTPSNLFAIIPLGPLELLYAHRNAQAISELVDKDDKRFTSNLTFSIPDYPTPIEDGNYEIFFGTYHEERNAFTGIWKLTGQELEISAYLTGYVLPKKGELILVNLEASSGRGDPYVGLKLIDSPAFKKP